MLAKVKQRQTLTGKNTYNLSGDDVLLLALVKVSNILDTEVVRLGSARGEDDFLWISADKFCDFL